MAVLALVKYGSSVLRQKAKRINRIDESVRKLAEDMLETMQANAGVGLAAPQVGVSRRLAVIQLPEEDEQPIFLVNPEIVKKSGEREVDEGCLSIPGYRGRLARAEAVSVKARDLDGGQIRIKGEGLLAQALEHEIDHLNGVLYVDRLKRPEDLRRLEPEPEEAEAEREAALAGDDG